MIRHWHRWIHRAALLSLPLAVLVTTHARSAEPTFPRDIHGDVRYFADKLWRVAIVIDDYDIASNNGKADHLYLFSASNPATGIKGGVINDASIVFGDDRVLRIQSSDGSNSLVLSLAPAPVVPPGTAPPPGIYGGIELVHYPLYGAEALATVTSGTFGSGSQSAWKPKPEDLAEGVSRLAGTVSCGIDGPNRDSGCAVECASGYHAACSANPRYGQRRCVCLKD